MSRTNRLLLDAAILVAYLAANNPATTGIAIHEWLSVGLALVVCVHIALNWEWIGHTANRLFRKARATSKLNFVVDLVLFAAFVMVMLSGLLISKVVMGVLGLRLAGGGIWRIAHGLSAQLALWALAAHFALHWKWMLSTAKRLFAAKTPSPAETPEAPTAPALNGGEL